MNSTEARKRIVQTYYQTGSKGTRLCAPTLLYTPRRIISIDSLCSVSSEIICWRSFASP